MVVERSSVALQDRWNVESLFPDLATWQKSFEECHIKERPHWPEFEAYRGKLANPKILNEFLEKYLTVSRKLSTLYTYAHLRHDEELTLDEYKVAFSKISSLSNDFGEESAWVEPELLELDQNTIDALLKAPELEAYRFYLEKILRLKQHTLSCEMEELIAKASKAMETSHKTFSAINDADFKFGQVLDGQGNKLELTHSTYGVYMREHDRILRKNAFEQLHNKFSEFENTLCELLNGEVQAHLFSCRARKYKSTLETALFPQNIDPQVYHALITAVNSEIPALHRSMELRKKILGVDELHLYDIYVPLTSDYKIEMSYDEAVDTILESVAPLGPEYQNLLKKGFKEDRWVDRYENKNKRSGAYSSGSYDSMPYILMNYKGKLKDVFTLTHEAGHSMHSLLTHSHQPYAYGHYSIFVAEVASTFNEELLMQLLLKRAKSKEEKIYLLNQKAEDIRATLFRQTMFAEFELLIHTLAEQEVPLTPTLLRQEYRKLNQKYFGPNVVIDSEIDIEWARIPHFYYNFYVYQYATGISAALALAERITHGGNQERDDYLTFLKGGSSRYPIDMLKVAGINMLEPHPVKAAIARYSSLLDQLSELLALKK